MSEKQNHAAGIDPGTIEISSVVSFWNSKNAKK
jgi:hypothetical protein